MNNKVIQAALEAGKEILKIYQSDDFQVESKDDKSPLTLADKRAHEKIMQHLSTTEYPVLSEESGDVLQKQRHQWNTYWLVDPLDGTKEFIHKNGEFTVNIALIQNHSAVEGVIYVPVQKKLYYTHQGKAYLQENITSIEQFSLSTSQKLEGKKPNSQITIVASKSHMSPETQQIIDRIQAEKPDKTIEIISVGSSLKLCWVAEGKADFYPRYAPTMEWDIAAGHAICKAAGVPVRQADSKEEVVYNKVDLLNPWFEVGTWK